MSEPGMDKLWRVVRMANPRGQKDSMNRVRLTLFLSYLGLATFVCAQTAPKYKLVEFDVPLAGQGENQGTVGRYLSADGAITGHYIDSYNMVHGFLRNSDGTFTTFDPTESVATYPLGVNATHVIVGTYNDAHGILHGFIRSADGKIAPYDAPGAGGGEGEGTILEAINTSGESVGYYLDANSSYHGFLLTSKGTFTQFDAPHAGTGPYQGTFPAGLTDRGAVGGTVYDANFEAHGFLRAAGGTFAEFDATSNAPTFVFGINSAETLVGSYSPETYPLGGFLRTANGEISVIGISGTTLGVNSINDAGVVVGYYANGDPLRAIVAYVRTPGGWVAYFKAPDAGTGRGQGTFPYANNNSGEITGTYVDSAGAYHGFVVE